MFGKKKLLHANDQGKGMNPSILSEVSFSFSNPLTFPFKFHLSLKFAVQPLETQKAVVILLHISDLWACNKQINKFLIAPTKNSFKFWGNRENYIESDVVSFGIIFQLL